MIYIDTNIILRYLLDDHIELSAKAKTIIENDSDLFICDGVFAEIVYVLSKVYNVEHEIIQQTLSAFLNKSNIFVSDKNIINKSLEIYAKHGIDYIDSLLCAYNHVKGIEVNTFDKKLRKLLN